MEGKKGKAIKPITEAENKRLDGLYRGLILAMHGIPETVMLKKAYEFARACHEASSSPRRIGGDPYMEHPLAVATLLAELGFESQVIGAALLHDVIEDCGITKEELAQEFGTVIAETVDALSAVTEKMVGDPEISKLDIDVLTDAKLLRATLQRTDKKAFYIKLADRIHNLQTIGVVPERKQRAKAANTRDILIPLARRMHIYRLVDILEDLCFKIDQPNRYRQIEEQYERLLYLNRYALAEVESYFEGLKTGSLEGMTTEMKAAAASLDRILFHSRSSFSIYRHLVPKVSSELELGDSIDKAHVALKNITFICNDEEDPMKIFFLFYPHMQSSELKLTITGIHPTSDKELCYFLLKDRYQNMYRFFVRTSQEYKALLYGMIVSEEKDFFGESYQVNNADPGDWNHPQIPVYRRDGTLTFIQAGATVLDLAFAIHPQVGICAKYALINHRSEQMPLYTKVCEGDWVEIVHDTDKNHPENDIPHATIRWFEYLRTREAIRSLSRWLEKNMESGKSIVRVFDSAGEVYEMENGDTVLDFVFLCQPEKAFYLDQVFINKSRHPAVLSKPVTYGDTIRLYYDTEEKVPPLSWLLQVRSKAAKERLVAAFENALQKTESRT